jgi:uncharacterized protein
MTIVTSVVAVGGVDPMEVDNYESSKTKTTNTIERRLTAQDKQRTSTETVPQPLARKIAFNRDKRNSRRKIRCHCVVFIIGFTSLVLGLIYDLLSSFSVTTTMASHVVAVSAFKNDPAIIRKILTTTKTIAVVGASSKADRPSNYVSKFLIDKGYKVIPVNPGLEGQEIHGQKVYPTLSSIDVPVDMVDIFRASNAVLPIVEDAIKINAKSVWMQVGVFNEEAADIAQKAGLDVVMNACPKVQIPLLGIDGPEPSASTPSQEKSSL